VIAMENARLINETREALEQQTATAEVLQVINASPGELEPVFDAMLEKAIHLCGADHGHVFTYDGELFRGVAARGDRWFIEWLRELGSFQPSQGITHLRLVQGARLVHLADLRQDEVYRSREPSRQAALDRTGIRSLVTVALRKDEVLLGAISVYRKEVRPFTDQQIALIQNFASQAVIAMENARLITETREALEQQTATAEVLQVINASPGDLTPVFDAILDKATALCNAAYGILWTYDEERFYPIVLKLVPPAFAEFLRNYTPSKVTDETPSGLGAMIRGEPFAHLHDAAAGDLYRSRRSPLNVAFVELGGARTGLIVPLRKDGVLRGAIRLFRQEVRPFTDREIALLQNFAAQAVIAMENARLITETREALEQQTATAEVLQVINSSPGDLTPVFDVMLEKAMRLCQATGGALRSYDGDAFHAVAMRGMPTEFLEATRKVRPDPDSGLGRVERGENVVQIADFTDTSHPRAGTKSWRWMTELGGIGTSLWVALRKEATLLGTFVLYRKEVRSFSEKEISLVQNFAAQAVIAIENARLLDEIRQRQQELRVTFDNMVDGVAMFDEGLHLAAWNRNFQELLQLPDEILAQRHDFDTYIRYLTERGEFGETDAETQIKRLRARIADHYSFERTRPDGTVIEVRNNPMPDGGIVVIYSDITERKRSEVEIRAARDAAEAAYRDLKAAQASLIQAEKMASLGQLTAGIAHEIKNPLNFVNNFADLSVELLDELKETAAPAIASLGQDKRTEIDETIGMLTGNLEKIAEHGRRADGIVKSMLEHSRGSSGDRRSIDINGLIEEALNLAYHGGRAQDASFNITLEQDFAEAIAPIELVPQDITRVCLNLFGNGFYAATKRQKEEGNAQFKPTLKVSTRDFGDTVELRVRDNGVGIAPEIKDKLFQPFFTTKPTGEGTGLGLSISYDIVTQQHGGTITVDSRVGEFTEFTVRLPRTHQTTMAEAAS
jgi:two-component system, NtrC family, sensor kinase